MLPRGKAIDSKESIKKLKNYYQSEKREKFDILFVINWKVFWII